VLPTLRAGGGSFSTPGLPPYAGCWAETPTPAPGHRSDTIERAKLSEARALLGAPSASGAIDGGLSDLVRRHRLLDDVRAHTETPPTADEAALGLASPGWSNLSDDTDWDAEWPESC
jgi:hypothetical protein